jgi:hypothetical protein
MMAIRTSVASVLYSVTTLVFPHGGGLDANGCHTNRKTGEYHCHRAQVMKPQPTLEQPRKAAAIPAKVTQRRAPECFVGPRGGTYTITASGRKNYNGC